MSKFHHLDKVTILGIGISVAISILMVILGQDEALSVIIGLAVTIITLLIDIISKIKQSEDKVASITTFGDTIAHEPQLRKLLDQIITDYNKIKQYNYPMYTEGTFRILQSCTDRIHEIAEGEMRVEMTGPYSFRLSGIDRVKKSMMMVQCDKPDYWHGEIGVKYLHAHKTAISSRNVDIKRIWVQSRDVLHKYRPKIMEQIDMKVDVFVADAAEVPPEYQEDFGIIDDEMIVKPIMAINGPREEVIQINQNVVRSYKEKFEMILRYTKRAEEYFNSVPEQVD